MSTGPRRRIAIVMMSALGDAVHVLPVITALKRNDPGCQITWFLQPGPASLMRGHPLVDEIIVFEKSKGWRALLDVRRALAGRSSTWCSRSRCTSRRGSSPRSSARP